MRADQILRMLSGVRFRCGGRWTALCPAHEDHSPSLSVRRVRDRVLLHCMAGCAVEDVCAAIGITLADLYHDQRQKPDPLVLRRRRAAYGLEATPSGGGHE